MKELMDALINYLEANPKAAEVRASVSVNGAGIESVNVEVKDNNDMRLDVQWQEFRQGNRELDVKTGGLKTE
jgi:hypothetical protein